MWLQRPFLQDRTPFSTLLVGCVFLFFYSTNSAQDLQWAKAAGGGSNDTPFDVVVDVSGNSYIAGTFQQSATFGTGEPNETVLSSVDFLDIFIAKYNTDGLLEWAKSAGGTALDGCSEIALDTPGNIYITGMFEGSATFGLGESNETTLTSSGSRDIYVAKYDVDGLLQWAKQAGSSVSNDHSQSIALDATGRIFLTGFFNDSTTFGMGEPNETVLYSSGSFDISVAGYDVDGTLLWAKAAGGVAFDLGADITVDAGGRSCVTGYFEGVATFGVGEVNETTLTASGARDIFIACYDVNGLLLWAKKAGGGADDSGSGIEAGSAGGSYLTGRFEGDAVFGMGELNETTLTSTGASDIFVARYNSNGLLQWAKQAGSLQEDRGLDIAVSASGKSSVTGHFERTATFGSGESNETSLTSAGANDIFVARYDGNGVLLWAKRAGGSAPSRGLVVDQGIGIGLDASDNSYVTGRFEGTARFGSGEVNETLLTSSGEGDMFIAKYRNDSSVGIEESPLMFDDFNLAQNYPNPFNSQSTIRYVLPRTDYVRLTLYDILGSPLLVLDEGLRSAGSHRIEFEAKDLPSGAYLYQLKTGSFQSSRWMLIVR